MIMSQTKELEKHYKEILRLLGEDEEREGLVKTPYRVAKAMQFLTKGYLEDPADILNWSFYRRIPAMVVVKDIEMHS